MDSTQVTIKNVSNEPRFIVDPGLLIPGGKLTFAPGESHTIPITVYSRQARRISVWALRTDSVSVGVVNEAETVEEDSSVYTCPKCRRGFDTERGLATHLRNCKTDEKEEVN